MFKNQLNRDLMENFDVAFRKSNLSDNLNSVVEEETNRMLKDGKHDEVESGTEFQ